MNTLECSFYALYSNLRDIFLTEGHEHMLRLGANSKEYPACVFRT